MTGRRFAYLGEAVGLLGSITANVADALVKPEVLPARWIPAYPGAPWTPSWGAILAAGFIPGALFIALEILTRSKWTRAGIGRYAAQAMVGLVAAVAAVVSYGHLHALLGDVYGWDQTSALIGPLVFDGLMGVSAASLLAAGDESAAEVAQDVPERTSPALGDGEPEPARAVAAAEHSRAPKVTSRARPKSPTSRKPTDDDLAALARVAIESGHLPAIPSNNAVRLRYGINHARAARVIDRATTPLEATS